MQPRTRVRSDQKLPSAVGKKSKEFVGTVWSPYGMVSAWLVWSHMIWYGMVSVWSPYGLARPAPTRNSSPVGWNSIQSWSSDSHLSLRCRRVLKRQAVMTLTLATTINSMKKVIEIASMTNVLLTLFEDPLPPLLALLLLSAMLLLGLLPILLLTTLPTAGPMTLPPSLILPMSTSVVIPVMAMVSSTMMAMVATTVLMAGFMIPFTMVALAMMPSSLPLAPPTNLRLHLSTSTLLGLP